MATTEADWQYTKEEPYFPWYISSLGETDIKNTIKPMLRKAEVSPTPDLPELNLKSHHLVFVYGTLKRGKSNHYLMKDAEYVCPGWTKLRCFHMWQTKAKSPVHASYPVAMITANSDEQEAKAIQGEIFKVDVPTMRDLDMLECNGSLYRRYRFKIICGDRFKDQETTAWMYVGKRDAWLPDMINSNLERSPSFKRKKDPKQSYYSFTIEPAKKSIILP